MRKIAVSIFVCMLLTSGILASANVINNKIESKNVDGEISVTVKAGNYKIENTEQGSYVSVEDFGQLLIPGKPNLPSKIISIAIPPGAKFVDLSFEVSDSITLTGSYNVPPVNLPRVISAEDSEVYQQELSKYTENYNSVYGKNNPYPYSAVEFVQTSGYRKYNLVDVRVNPFTYYPLSGKLVYNSEIKISVRYDIPEGFDNVMVDNIPVAEQRAERIVYNYDQAKDWYPSNIGGTGTYDYVIITLSSLTSSVTSLVDWEEIKGRTVYVATTDWIADNYNGYDLAEKIRNFLRDKYPSDEWGILDVCIIGGYDDVPMRRCWQDEGYGKPETDYYYAELSLPDSESWDADGDHQWGENSDPIDFYGEVSVGRIPWSDSTTVTNICEKSVAYEQNNDPSFKKNILLLGAFFWDDTDNAVLMEYKTNPSIHPWMADWTKTKMYEDAQSSYQCDYDLSYDNVKNVWSAGTYAFVDWAGHGSPTACYELYPSQPFVDTATCNYLNDDYPAIIFADACSNSDTDDLNIGQAMLKKGGVGFLGSTKVAYGMPAWNNPDSGSSQSLDYYFTTCVTSGNYTQGQAHQWSLTKMYTDDLWYYLKYETFEWGALWGNPDLTMDEIVLSDPPLIPPKPTGPEIGILNETCTFSTSTTDPNDDQVYYKWNWGDGNFSEWLGPYNSGETAQASYTWTGLGSYLVKVKARDSWGAASSWSEPLYVAIVTDTSPNPPTLDGPTNGKTGVTYPYEISTIDPNGDDIYYFVFWGDGTSTGWMGPYKSGEVLSVSHKWDTKGTYIISAKAKDVVGYESYWTTLEITMPRNRIAANCFLNNLFQILLQLLHGNKF